MFEAMHGLVSRASWVGSRPMIRLRGQGRLELAADRLGRARRSPASQPSPNCDQREQRTCSPEQLCPKRVQAMWHRRGNIEVTMVGNLRRRPGHPPCHDASHEQDDRRDRRHQPRTTRHTPSVPPRRAAAVGPKRVRVTRRGRWATALFRTNPTGPGAAGRSAGHRACGR